MTSKLLGLWPSSFEITQRQHLAYGCHYSVITYSYNFSDIGHGTCMAWYIMVYNVHTVYGIHTAGMVYIQYMVWYMLWCTYSIWYGICYGVYTVYGMVYGMVHTVYGMVYVMVYIQYMVWCMLWCTYSIWYGICYGVHTVYGMVYMIWYMYYVHVLACSCYYMYMYNHVHVHCTCRLANHHVLLILTDSHQLLTDHQLQITSFWCQPTAQAMTGEFFVTWLSQHCHMV